MEKLCLKFMLFASLLVTAGCKPPESGAGGPIDGTALFKMGLQYNKPLLRLIGKSLIEMECRSHSCSEWSAWSACELFAEQFGMKRRSRQCDVDDKCKSAKAPGNETESMVCQEFCPSDYDMIEGFCLKFYNSTAKNQASAEAACQKDGGHLVNINSQRKWNAFAALMDKYKYTGYPHIGGQRKDSSSPWTYSYETHTTGYMNWASGQPDNGSTDLCICASNGSASGMHDVPCSDSRHYVCEKVPTV